MRSTDNITKLRRIAMMTLTTAVGLAGVTEAIAQPASNLREAVGKALLENPEVKFRYHNLGAAKKEREVAEGGKLPRVDLEAGGGSYRYLSPSTPSTSGYDGNRASVQLRQMLFDGQATSNEVRRLSFAEQAAFYEFVSVSHQTGLEVTRAYIDVLRYRELVTLAEDNFLAHRDVQEKILEKVNAGVGRRVDLEQSSGRLALAESNWLTEVSNLHDVSARFQRLVGITPPTVLAGVQSPDGLVPASIDFLKESVIKHPDFLSAVANIRAFRADERLKRSALSPTVELRARHGMATNQTGSLGGFRDSSLEVVLNYNLYRGGSDLARAKQSAAKLESAFELRDKACRDIRQTGQIAFNDSIRLESQLKFLSLHELSTSKAKQAYQQQFDIGQRSLLDLLDTENELYQARRALNNADYDLKLAKYRVLAISGSLLTALELQTTGSELRGTVLAEESEDELAKCDSEPIPTVKLNLPPQRSITEIQPLVTKATPVQLVTTTLPTEPVKPEITPLQCTQLPSIVQSWVTAWNTKDLASYLNFYAQNFSPALGLSKGAWEKLRKKRITKQGTISANLSQISTKSCSNKLAEVTFTQEYGSSDYKDQVEKVLSLEWITDTWKITRETVIKGRNY